MTLKWTFDSAHSSAASATTATSIATGTVTPNVGDLLVLSVLNVATTHNTSITITDTGSGGWNLIRSVLTGNGTSIGGAWWKIATATDHAGIVVTATFAGGASNTLSRIECDVFRVAGFTMLGLDAAGIIFTTSSVTTQTASGASLRVSDNDTLVWDTLMSSVSNGGITLNRMTTTNFSVNTYNLITTGIGTPLILSNSWNSVVNTPAVGDSVDQWIVNWTTARANTIVIGATFTYQHTAGLLPILGSV